ncbi:N-acetyltransferase [Sphingomicrobium astaxanthinifaciens]|uniref:N-acetyltransferase n=1 Tax=Sphingomicrobium astaxanthinifaciens TaxID=1227949 RepID=UPI001FCAC5FB|nr:N-acetyltransferase [Sphingomicrobium astaxanthinifaciens]MCJ7420814.1 N-acetyltransferase [Sphingomicrobium astaxanthinifaciens]
MSKSLSVTPVRGRADRAAFIDLPWAIYADDPHWVAPLKAEVRALLDPRANPWFAHGDLQLFLARRGEEVVGRISAHVDHLWAERYPGQGHWGLFEAKDAETAAALIAAAEDWLRAQGMTSVVGPFSLSIWDEPGLLIEGFEEPPMVMMGHHRPVYQRWVEAAGYAKIRDLLTFALDIRIDMIPVIDKLIKLGEKNPRIVIRDVDKSRFDEEAAIILDILNDAWSDNWGYIPLTDAEIAQAGKKLKPIIVEDLVKIAEVDGEPVAFMLTIPDINELIADLDGRLFPFGWAKLLWRLRKPYTRRVRVPLMGVRKSHQKGRMASQLAFMMIEYTRRVCVNKYGINFGEFGWVLEDNQGMMSIAQLPGAGTNHTYRVYQKAL